MWVQRKSGCHGGKNKSSSSRPSQTSASFVKQCAAILLPLFSDCRTNSSSVRSTLKENMSGMEYVNSLINSMFCHGVTAGIFQNDILVSQLLTNGTNSTEFSPRNWGTWINLFALHTLELLLQKKNPIHLWLLGSTHKSLTITYKARSSEEAYYAYFHSGGFCVIRVYAAIMMAAVMMMEDVTRRHI